MLTCAENNPYRLPEEICHFVTASRGLKYSAGRQASLSNLSLIAWAGMMPWRGAPSECLSSPGISRSNYSTNGRYLTMILVRDDPEEFPAQCLRTTFSGPTIFYIFFHHHVLDVQRAVSTKTSLLIHFCPSLVL